VSYRNHGDTVAKTESNFTHSLLPPKSQLQCSWNVAIGMKQRDVSLFFQSMRRLSDQTVGVFSDIRGARSQLNVRLNSKRTTISSPGLAGVELFGCLSFARREGACRTANRFVASSTTFPLASGDILPLDNVVFHHCRCIRAIGDSIGIELLFIPQYAPWFNGIEGVLCIVKSTDGSFG